MTSRVVDIFVSFKLRALILKTKKQKSIKMKFTKKCVFLRELLERIRED